MDNNKNNAHKFTIQFNNADPQHHQAVEILNKHGRRKAQFIVNAVLHYNANGSNGETVNYSDLENIVRKIICDQNHFEKNTDEIKQVNQKTNGDNANITFDNSINGETIKSIVGSLALV